MGFIEKLTSGLNNVFRNKEEVVQAPKTAASSISYATYSDTKENQEEFLSNIKGWTYSCINAISDQVAAINLKLFRLKEDGSSEEIFDHEILDVLYKVNNFTTRYDHFWLTQAFLEAVGEAPWFVDRNEQGKVDSIYFLSPSKLEPIPDKEKLVSGYKYDLGMGRSVTLPANSVIFNKYPNPANPFRGLGTMEAAAMTIDLDNYAEKWNRNFFKNSAKPHSLLKIKNTNLDKKQRDALRNDIKETYQGLDKAHGTMVLFGEMDLTPFGASQRDMDFIEQQKFARDKILGIFRVPKAVVAQTEGSNFASAKTAQYAFAKWTIKPKMERLVQQLNEFFVPLFDKSENLYLDYDNPVPEDEEVKLRTYDSGLNYGWLSVNEVRAMEGLESVDGGDELKPVGQPVPVGYSMKTLVTPKKSKKVLANNERARSIKARKNKNVILKTEKVIDNIKEEIKTLLRKELSNTVKKKVQKKSILKKDVNGEVVKKGWTAENKSLFWNAKNKIYENYIDTVKSKHIELFKNQKDTAVSDFLEKFYKSTEKALPTLREMLSIVLINKKKATKKYTEEFSSVYRDIYDESFKTTSGFVVGNEGGLSSDELAASTFIKNSTTQVAKNITDTTNKLIKEQLAEGLKEGESILQMADRIRFIFDDSEQNRADMIARTETSRYSEKATLDVYRESGVVEAKEWVVNDGACAFCEEFDGKVIKLDDDFLPTGGKVEDADGNEYQNNWDTVESPPLHVNCRCTTAPIFK